MSPLGRRPPPNAELPEEIVCKWCGTPRKNHCYAEFRKRDGSVKSVRRNRKCNWYPCRACSVVTVYDRLHRTDEGGWAWTVTWQKVPKSWFV